MAWNLDADIAPACWSLKAQVPPIRVTPGMYPLAHDTDQAAVTLIAPNMENGPWIAGGAPLRWELGESVDLHHDIDVWFRDPEQFSAAVLRVREHADIVIETPNAHTYRFYHANDGTRTIQLVKANFFESAQEVIEHFDFSVCQIVTDGKTIRYGEHTRADICARRLRVVKSRDDCAKRIVKYLAYGFKMSLEDIRENFAMTKTWQFTHEDYEAVKL